MPQCAKSSPIIPVFKKGLELSECKRCDKLDLSDLQSPELSLLCEQANCGIACSKQNSL